nr:MAG TPA: tail component [Caudoviricetes sp.]
MIKDKLTEIYNALKSDEALSGISIKSFKRPETLPEKEPSIVIIPVGPPLQSDRGSNTSLSKTFLYQINVESTDRIKCKELQGAIEKVMESEGFYQTDGGLDEWIPEIKRYADARTYKGKSRLHDDY